jgi:hypothetical protein
MADFRSILNKSMITLTRRRASSIIFDLVSERKGKWIIPDNVCHTVYASILAAGGQLILTDINHDTLELDPDIVLDILKSYPNVQGMIMVRTYGNTSQNYYTFFEEARSVSNQLFIIDDRCLAIPELSVEEENADVYLFSTGYSKVVDLGYGGYAFSTQQVNSMTKPFATHDEKRFDDFFRSAVYSGDTVSLDELNKISNTNWLNFDSIDETSYLNSVSTAKTEVLKLKQQINSIYMNLKPEFILGEHFNSWRFNIVVSNRDEILYMLTENNLFASKHYYPLSTLSGQPGNDTWKSIYPNIINLFNDFRYTFNQAEQTVALINKYGKPLRQE